MLETVGIRGPILDCIKSLYSHDSAAVRTQEGISDIFDCLIGVKQGCPLSATLFGLFVDGLEQHLMDTVGHDAPSLSGALIPLLLYADDLTIMSTTPAGLQRQLNALQLFCEQRQLTVNLAKTKVVVFGSRARCQAFTFNGIEVKRVQSYKYLGLNFMQPKICCMVSPRLFLLPTKQCMPWIVGAPFCTFLIPNSAASFLTVWYCPFLVTLVRSELLTKHSVSQQSNCIGNV